MGSGYSDEDLAMQLLVSMPESYNNTVDNIEISAEMASIKVGYKKCKEILVGEYNKCQSMVPGVDGAFYGQHFKGKNNGQQNNNRNGNNNNASNFNDKLCQNCEKKGHNSCTCRKPASVCENCGAKYHMTKFCKKDKKDKGLESIVLVLVDKVNIHIDKIKADWCADSGATSHMCRQRELFVIFKVINHPIIIGDKSTVMTVGVGNVQFISVVGEKSFLIMLCDVLYEP